MREDETWPAWCQRGATELPTVDVADSCGCAVAGVQEEQVKVDACEVIASLSICVGLYLIHL
jgi:hypothetical protein